jgi:hypothetical protein
MGVCILISPSIMDTTIPLVYKPRLLTSQRIYDWDEWFWDWEKDNLVREILGRDVELN